MCVIFVIDIVNDDDLASPINERLGVDTLTVVIMNFKSDDNDYFDDMVSSLKSWGS